jgi:hypothetical protein
MAERAYDARVAAGGAATITIQVGSRTRRWILQQISLELVGATGFPLLATFRKNGRQVAQFIATGDVLAGDPPVPLEPYDTATLEWIGISPVGALARATVFFDEVTV